MDWRCGGVQAHCKIVLVPAPSDPGCFGTVPQRPLPKCVAQPLLKSPADVILASNPCRIQFFRKEVVIFNSPSMDAFQAHALVQSTGAGNCTRASRRLYFSA